LLSPVSIRTPLRYALVPYSVSRALAVTAVSLVVSPAHADALQQAVLAGAKAASPADFAFTQTSRNERTGTPAREVVTRYDPRRGAAAWQLLRVDGKPPSDKDKANLAKMAGRGPVPSYGRIAQWFGSPATRIATTPTSVTYRFASLPKGALKLGSYDASDHTSVEAVVNTAGKTPFLERARFTSTKPFRMFVVAKIERFTFNATWRLLPDGRPVPEINAGEFGGSFMGSAQTMKTRTSYGDFAAAR
jgi:hypothetical protein